MLHTSKLQNMLQTYSNWNSMVLIGRQTYEQMEQNSSETNPCIYGQMIFDKGSKTTQWGKDKSTNVPGDFPGGPVAKTLHSQCMGPRFNPWSGN